MGFVGTAGRKTRETDYRSLGARRIKKYIFLQLPH
jgi:hypothetical protein